MTTREKILHFALALFNDQGVGSVSTNHIADEAGISPGNLYYHFRNKEDIVRSLFAIFEDELDAVLNAPSGARFDAEDLWVYLHLAFETIWRYRFLYRNLVDIAQEDRAVARRIQFLLERKIDSASRFLTTLAESGKLHSDQLPLRAVAENIVLVMTFWLNYQQVNKKGHPEDLSPGVYQVMMLVAPLLQPAERAHWQGLAASYLR